MPAKYVKNTACMLLVCDGVWCGVGCIEQGWHNCSHLST